MQRRVNASFSARTKARMSDARLEFVVSSVQQAGRGVLRRPPVRGTRHRGFAIAGRKSSVLHFRYNFGTFEGERKSGCLSLSGTR